MKLILNLSVECHQHARHVYMVVECVSKHHPI